MSTVIFGDSQPKGSLRPKLCPTLLTTAKDYLATTPTRTIFQSKKEMTKVTREAMHVQIIVSFGGS